MAWHEYGTVVVIVGSVEHGTNIHPQQVHADTLRKRARATALGYIDKRTYGIGKPPAIEQPPIFGMHPYALAAPFRPQEQPLTEPVQIPLRPACPAPAGAENRTDHFGQYLIYQLSIGILHDENGTRPIHKRLHRRRIGSRPVNKSKDGNFIRFLQTPQYPVLPGTRRSMALAHPNHPVRTAGGKEIAAVPHDRKRRHIPYRLVLLKLAPYNHKISPSLYDAAAPQFGYGGTRRHSGNRKPKGIPGMRGHASAPVSRNVQKRSDT